MRKNLFLLLLAAMFTMVSCDYNEDQVTVNTSNADQEAIVDGKVPLSRAISNADFIFRNTEGLGAKKRKVKSVDVLTTSNTNSVIANTRSGVDGQAQPVAYVVNYENNEGFAILAADTKLPPVIGIGDEGNFNTQGFIDFVRNRATRTGGSELNPAQEVQYAIVNNSLLLPPNIIGPGPTNCVDTTIVLKCLPLVRTKWGQTDPYNYYADPYVNSYYETVKGVAGCVPVAGAQVIASLCFHHNWRPTTQISEQYIVDWEKLNKIIFNGVIGFDAGTYTDDALVVASLIRAVGEDVGAQYGAVTGAYTYDLADTYEKLGMSSTHYGNEESDIPITRDDLFNMIIYKNFPVNVSARTYVEVGSTTTAGHSFVLDGWLRLEYSTVNADIGMNGTSIINRQHNFDLVHVNLGWKGDNDGYYLPDAFDLTEDKYREYAELNDKEDATQYVFDLNVNYIIYEM
ncbi:MAG: hypothetical protein E7141_03745 [Rikenellaceae bacterium]|nr:hypothetical protein [Rikenellaceae bacterium]